MTFLRNLLTLCGVLAIVAVSVYIFRPDLYNNIIAKNAPQQAPLPTGEVYGTFSKDKGVIGKDVAAPEKSLPFVYADLIDGEATNSVPANNAPFLLVVNKAKNEMRYWKLNKNVRSVGLIDNKSSTVDMQFKQINSPNAPFQAILWIPRESDFSLKFELGTTPPKS